MRCGSQTAKRPESPANCLRAGLPGSRPVGRIIPGGGGSRGGCFVHYKTCGMHDPGLHPLDAGSGLSPRLLGQPKLSPDTAGRPRGHRGHPAPLPELRTTGRAWNRGGFTPNEHLPLPTASHRAHLPGCNWPCAVLPAGGALPPGAPSRLGAPPLPHKPHFFPPLPPRNSNTRLLPLPCKASQLGQGSPPHTHTHKDVGPDLVACSGRQGGGGCDRQRV